MVTKKPSEFSYFQDKKVSLLIDHPRPNSKLKESYVGTLIGETDTFVILYIGYGRLKTIWIRKAMILSIWEYQE